MKTKPFLRSFTLVFLTTLLLLVLDPAGSLIADNGAVSQAALPATEKSIDRSDEFTSNGNALTAASTTEPSVTTTPLIPLPCPSPTAGVGNQCVLTRDVDLSQALVLPSNKTLNCQGHTLRPRLAFPPQVAIFLNDVRNVRIRRCVIDGFDFGIFAIDSKRPPESSAFMSFEMSANTINARYTAVSLISVDDAQVDDNDISYTRAGGRALYIGRDSDSNEVRNNRFFANLASGPGNVSAFRVPGLESTANPEVRRPGAAVVITQIEGPEPTLLNAVINGKLFQLRIRNTLDSSGKFSQSNIFEGNKIRFTSVAVDGVVVSVAQATLIRNNTIESGAAVGIRLGIQNGVTKDFPGRCTSDPPGNQRLCLDNAGCKISGVEGKCVGLDPQTVNWITRSTIIDDNTISGPFVNGINTNGQHTAIINNTIDGKSVAGSVGIRLIGKHALESSRITRNSVSNVDVALNLIQIIQGLEGLSFGTKITFNDFIGYQTAVLTTMELDPADACYHLASDLSADERGNFWGNVGNVPCLGLNPANVKKSDGSRDPKVTDSHPYDTPVAKGPLFPSPCPKEPAVVP